MKIKDIELVNISRYRGELMGAAMLFIMLFHVSLPRNDLFSDSDEWAISV